MNESRTEFCQDHDGADHQRQERRHKTNPQTSGAFWIEQRLPVYLDVDFAETLLLHMQRSPTDNPAIRAFMHRLRQVIGDAE